MEKTGMMIFLRNLRKERGLTQPELDRAVKFAVSTIGQLESGAKPFTDARINKLRMYFGLTEAEWYMGAKQCDPMRHRNLSEPLQKLLDVLASCPLSVQYQWLERVQEQTEAERLTDG